jgi:serine protease AprX
VSTKHVIAHFMHASEREAALQLLSAATATDCYVLGQIDESQLEDLRAKGLIVELAFEAPANDFPGPVPEQSVDSSDQGTDLESGPTVPAPARVVAFDLLLFRSEEAPVVLAWLGNRGIAVAGASRRKIRVILAEDSTKISEIAGLASVQTLETSAAAPPERIGTPILDELTYQQKYRDSPKLHNNRARVLLGIDNWHPGVGVIQSGIGQIVGIADTGIDDQHPDFNGRIVGRVPLGRPRDTSDPHGHGTHVAGSALGDGSGSGGQISGVAPGATLFFQSLLDAKGTLGGLPFELSTLFDEAYQNGVRIHNNSWGSATSSRYTISSGEVDEYVASHRDMLIVIAAGNEGATINRNPWRDSNLSIASPATCKNALTVGASRSDRTTTGTLGDPQALAPFSSRGPSDDFRIKPDVVAPGTDIVSCKSSTAPFHNFWGAFPGNELYAFMGGTSMAAPLVTGCAALVREYFAANRHHDPSAALLKATLINGTKSLPSVSAKLNTRGVPDFNQGFGSINLKDTVPGPDHPDLTIEFIDDWKSANTSFAKQGQRFRFRFSVAGPARMLRLCLAYTDFPGRGLQNSLNLFVQLPSEEKLVGNESLLDSSMVTDRNNNVEIVRLDNPAPGDYLIQVAATFLLKAPQDFALVVAGENITPLVRV